MSLPQGTELTVTDLAGAAIPFRTLSAVNVSPIRLAAVQRKERTRFVIDGRYAAERDAGDFRRCSRVRARIVSGVRHESRRPESRCSSTSKCPAIARESGRRELLQSEHGGALPPHHSARVAWEYRQAGAFGNTWAGLPATDGTRSLTLSGSLAFAMPADFSQEPLGGVAAPLYWVRVRFASGAYDAPPSLAGVWPNAVEAEQSVSASDTLVVAKGVTATGAPPAAGENSQVVFRLADQAIAALDFKAVEPGVAVLDYRAASATVPGSLVLRAVFAGTSTGEPNQTFRLRRAPVLEEDFALFSIEKDGYRAWARRDDLAASSRRDAHFLLDCDAGEIRFGDGEHASVPSRGALLLAVYRQTLADGGGLPAGRITLIADSPWNRVAVPNLASVRASVSAANVTGATGGAAGETLAHAIGRAMEIREASVARSHSRRLREHRARNSRDADRACDGTGLCHPGPRLHSHARYDHGTVLPAMPGPRPTPSQGLLGQIAARIERRRIIGTRVFVTAPRYLDVSVRASVRAFPNVSQARLIEDVSNAINEFLHPLRGGPDGTGWPFGRDVYRSEIMQVIDGTPGVDYVASLELVGPEGTPQCGNLCLQATWLVAAGPHKIEVL